MEPNNLSKLTSVLISVSWLKIFIAFDTNLVTWSIVIEENFFSSGNAYPPLPLHEAEEIKEVDK